VFVNGGDLLATALAHGLAIGIGVTAIGHVSGGHLNPAITIAMVVMRQKGLVEGLAYIAAQLAGAVVGTLLIMWGFDLNGSDLVGSVPALKDGLAVGNGILLEAVATLLHGWVVFAVAVDRDGAWFKVAGLPIGFAVTAGILMIGSGTGAALNPARWFGPALVTTTWDNAAVWIVGPIVGAALAGAAYLYGIKPRLAGAAAAPDTV
jgi:MIP family channel proteins